MKKLAHILLILLATSTLSFGQRGQKMERIHAAKMAYITDRLHLTSDQSVRFVPVYNEYEQEIFNTRQSYFKKYKGSNMDDASDASARQYVDDNLDYQQQVIEIKRKYNDRFLTVLSPKQLADMHTAEREFRQILMKRLDQSQRRGGGGRFGRGN